jgi:hypothetical protein
MATVETSLGLSQCFRKRIDTWDDMLPGDPVLVKVVNSHPAETLQSVSVPVNSAMCVLLRLKEP